MTPSTQGRMVRALEEAFAAYDSAGDASRILGRTDTEMKPCILPRFPPMSCCCV